MREYAWKAIIVVVWTMPGSAAMRRVTTSASSSRCRTRTMATRSRSPVTE